MNRRTLALCGLVGLTAFGQMAVAQSSAPPKPKLVLGIVVDQFRLDYFYRFKDQYNGGLARLYNEGAFFTNAYYIHFPTVTAIGHSTFLSGAIPAVSGIVGNEWYDRATKKQVTSVSDGETELLGGKAVKGSSPRRMMVSTVADEIKMSGRFASKSVGISIKDRSAILPNGRMGDGAYWFDNDTGNMVSSSYYFAELPAWVKAFNDSKVAGQACGTEWKSVETGKALMKMPEGQGEACYSAMERSPFGNELLETFAEQAIEHEKLGQGDGLDVLTVSFSANDYVGHRVGPDDPQVRDISIRTDRLLAKFLDYVDKKVGLANVVIAFTADHGVAPLPEVMQQRKMPGGRLNEKAVLDKVEARLSELYGPAKWVVGKSGPAPYLDHQVIAAKKLDAALVRKEAAEAARSVDHIYRVYTWDELAAATAAGGEFASRVQNGFHPSRSADLFIVVEPYYLFEKSGTSHGTPFNYDSHVPVVLMGAGIKPGRYHRRVSVNDIAPTLATLLEVETPSGSVGRVLVEALR